MPTDYLLFQFLVYNLTTSIQAFHSLSEFLPGLSCTVSNNEKPFVIEELDIWQKQLRDTIRRCSLTGRGSETS